MKHDVAKWLTPESLTLLRGMACVGKSREQIAACMGISPTMLARWQKRYPELAAARLPQPWRARCGYGKLPHLLTCTGV